MDASLIELDTEIKSLNKRISQHNNMSESLPTLPQQLDQLRGIINDMDKTIQKMQQEIKDNTELISECCGVMTDMNRKMLRTDIIISRLQGPPHPSSARYGPPCAN